MTLPFQLVVDPILLRDSSPPTLLERGLRCTVEEKAWQGNQKYPLQGTPYQPCQYYPSLQRCPQDKICYTCCWQKSSLWVLTWLLTFFQILGVQSKLAVSYLCFVLLYMLIITFSLQVQSLLIAPGSWGRWRRLTLLAAGSEKTGATVIAR